MADTIIRAAGGVIFRETPAGKEILVIQRQRYGDLGLPKGKLNPGESPEEAAIREVREETGLQVDILSRFDIFERILCDAQGRAEYHYVLIDYVCKMVGGEPLPGDDVSRLEWVPCARLRDYKVTSGTIEAVERAYSHELRTRS